MISNNFAARRLRAFSTLKLATLKPAAAMLVAVVLTHPLRAQTCTNEATQWVEPVQTEGSPLGCPYAATAPAWRLYTPGYRQSVPSLGSTFVEALPRAQVLVRYRCTGNPLWPIVVDETKTLGYVLDVVVAPCGNQT